MTTHAIHDSETEGTELPFAGHLSVTKMPAHWLMARLGKRVLRPGGLGATRWLIEHVAIGSSDDVIELAPGMGLTARLLLAQHPKTYAGVDRDKGAADVARRNIAKAGLGDVTIHEADASEIPVPDGAASVVFGEAMLSMQRPAKKKQIIAEAARVLRSGGRYAIHELAVQLKPGEDLERVAAAVQKDLSTSIHVGVRIGTPDTWRALLEEAGFDVEAESTFPMRLLEWDRLIQDEGIFGTLKIIVNAIRTPGAVKRLRAVRGSFKKHADHLIAVTFIARKR